MVYVFLAGGFEEVEALAPVDFLRRCDLDVTVVGIGGEYITGSHGITVKADIADCNLDTHEDASAIILPGGMPGTLNLEHSETVQNFIQYASEKDIPICAICAAPSILGHLGLLSGKRATCFPGFEEQLTGADVTGGFVEQDGNFITAKGAGCAVEFAYTIAKTLAGDKKADKVRRSLQCIK